MVTIRVPSDRRTGRRQQETREFTAVRKDLLALGDWLACWGVTRAGMEATGDYWKPGLLCPGIARVRLPAVQRRAGQGTARPAQDGPVNRTTGRGSSGQRTGREPGGYVR